jgi:flagellar basal body-associated protein FliL
MPLFAADARTAPAGAEAPPPRAGAGKVVLLGALVVAGLVGGLVLLARKPAVPPPPPAPIQRPYEQVELGAFRKEILVDAATFVREHFEVKVALLLNPAYGDLAVVRPLVERRRDLLRHIVATEIIHPKSDFDLRKPTILESLNQEIRARLNAELGLSPAGQELVHKVIFPDSKLPLRR